MDVCAITLLYLFRSFLFNRGMNVTKHTYTVCAITLLYLLRYFVCLIGVWKLRSPPILGIMALRFLFYHVISSVKLQHPGRFEFKQYNFRILALIQPTKSLLSFWIFSINILIFKRINIAEQKNKYDWYPRLFVCKNYPWEKLEQPLKLCNINLYLFYFIDHAFP